MISAVELMVLAVYAAMAGYIVHLQIKLKKTEKAGAFLTMVLHDIATGEVDIERTDNGIRIRKGDREVQVRQR
jgi:hypothetical protein